MTNFEKQVILDALIKFEDEIRGKLLNNELDTDSVEMLKSELQAVRMLLDSNMLSYFGSVRTYSQSATS